MRTHFIPTEMAIKVFILLVVVVHAYNPNTWEAEAGGL
jgi:hypothetical protein